MKKLLLLLTIICFQFTYSQSTKNEIEINNNTFSEAEFPNDTFSKFLAKNFRLSEDSNFSGRVIFTFIVEIDGTLTYSNSNSKNIEPWIEEEIKRVLKLSPIWKPAFKNNKPIRTQLTAPINIYQM